jgi:hypothetical protein
MLFAIRPAGGPRMVPVPSDPETEKDSTSEIRKWYLERPLEFQTSYQSVAKPTAVPGAT